MKRLLIPLLALLSLTSQAQNITEYFYRVYYNNPSGIIFRNARFSVSHTDGGMQEYEEWDLSDNRNTITSSYEVREGEYKDWVTMSVTKHQLSYTNDAVYSISRASRNGFMPGSTVCKDKITLLIFPMPDGSVRKWKETDNGSKYNCTSEWTYVNAGEYWAQVIKISKTHTEYNITETSYWAPYYGNIWVTQTSKEKGTRTIKRRYQFNAMQEVTEKDFVNEQAKQKFLQKHKGEVHTIAQDSPETYKALQDAFANYLVNYYKGDFLYDAGSCFTGTDIPKWLSVAKDWRSFALKYYTTVNTSISTCYCYDMLVNEVADGRESNSYVYEKPKGSWALPALRRCEAAGTFEMPHAIEPVSGFRLNFDLKDNFAQTVDISALWFKVKYKKGGFEFVKGYENYWEKLHLALAPHLFDLMAKSGKSTFVARVIRFQSGPYTRYVLVTDCKKYQPEYGFLECKIVDLDVK